MPTGRKKSPGGSSHSPVGNAQPGRRRNERPRTVRRFAQGKGGTSETSAPLAEGTLRVLALDSSSRACGWSVFDDGKLAGYGHYRQQGKGHAERLVNFRLWLLDMFARWAPAEVVYEVPFQSRNSHAFGVLTKYVAAIEIAHFEYKGEEVPEENAIVAHAVKKAIKAPKPQTGKKKTHDANKKIVLLMVNEHFGLNLKFKANDTTKSVSQDDDADAIALNWAWHIRRARNEREVLD